MISLFYVTMFVLNAKLCSIYALIFEVFGGLNLVSLSVWGVGLLKKSGLIFKSPVATLHSAHRKLTPRQSCTILDRGSGQKIYKDARVGSGPGGLGTQIWRHNLVIKCRLFRISFAFDIAQCCT